MVRQNWGLPLSQEERELLTAAAKKDKLSRNDFIRRAALKEAEKVLKEK